MNLRAILYQNSNLLAIIGRLLRQLEGRVPDREKPRAIPRSRDRMQPLFKLRLNVVEYL